LVYVFARDEDDRSEAGKTGKAGSGPGAGEGGSRSGEAKLNAESSALRPRDIVILIDQRLRLLARGIVHSISTKGIGVQLDDSFDAGVLETVGEVTLCKAGSEATHRYQAAALACLESGRPLWEGEAPAPLGEARRALLACFFSSFSGHAADRKALHEIGSVRATDNASRPSTAAISSALDKFSLNPQQRLACECILKDNRLSGVWGPPGTGKTTTVSAAIASYLILNPGKRVLACAPSNTAVDNIVLGVAKALDRLGKKVPLLRLGNPARATSEEVYPYLLEVLVNAQASSEVSSLRLEVQRLTAALDKAKKQAAAKGARGLAIEARHALRDGLRALSDAQYSAVENVLLGARLICSTLGSLGSNMCLKAAKANGGFDLVVVDEAGQALDASLISALLLCKGQLCLAGDPMQLPPTILSEGLKGKPDFAVPFMTRLVSPPAVAPSPSPVPGPEDSSGVPDKAPCDGDGGNPGQSVNGAAVCDVPTVTLLETQYRFNSELTVFPSHEFYGDRLVAAPTCASISVCDFLSKEVDSWFDGDAPKLIFVDTAGFDLRESRQEGKIVPAVSSAVSSTGKKKGAKLSNPRAASSKGSTALSFLDQYSLKNDGEVSLTVQLFRLVRDSILSRAPPHAAKPGAGTPPGLSTAEDYCLASGIISPYASQVSALSAALDWELDHGLEISTVDGFQGREKEIIFISMVRSNDSKEVGFLSDYRRLNVSVTRAKRLLVIIGDSETLEADKVLSRFVSHLMDNALVFTPDTLPELEAEGR